MLCLRRFGMVSFVPGLRTILSTILSESAAASNIGLIGALANLGGFLGPYVMGTLYTRTHSYFVRVDLLTICLLLAALLVLTFKPSTQTQRIS